MASSAKVTASMGPLQRAGVAFTPSATPRGFQVQPISMAVARQMVERHHCLRSPPGSTHVDSGAFGSSRSLGVLTLQAGIFNGAFLVGGAEAGKPQGASGGGNGSGR
jgi:hypothetical protein